MFELLPFTKSTLKFFCLQQTFAKPEVSPSEPEISLTFKLSDSGEIIPEHNMRNEVCTEARQGNQV